MAADKNVEAQKVPETQKDVDTKKAPGPGEPSIEYVVDGLTEDELKKVSGGLATGDLTKLPMKCGDMTCKPFTNPCYEYCQAVGCRDGFTCTDQLGCPGQSWAR